MRRNLNQSYAGRRVLDLGSTGVLGSTVPSSGQDGAGYLYNDVVNNSLQSSEVRGRILSTTLPANSWYAWSDSRFRVDPGVPDGVYSVTYELFVFGTKQPGTGTITINVGASAPSFTTQPSNQSVVDGATATFSVVAAGLGPITYQWQRNPGGNTSFANISGATSSSYTTPTTVYASNNGDTYRCLVTNSGGTSTSNAALLTVNALVPSISVQPVGSTVAEGATATFSVVASGTPTLTYQWQRNPGGNTSFNNIAGATSSSYTTPATTVTGGTANNGDTYRCVVSNPGGSINSSAVTLTVSATATAPSVTLQPVNQSIFAGGAASFSITAIGTAPLSYQWQRNPGGNTSFANIVGATSAAYTTPTAEVSGGLANNGDTYRCVVTNSIGSVASNVALLSVSPFVTGSVASPLLRRISIGPDGRLSLIL